MSVAVEWRHKRQRPAAPIVPRERVYPVVPIKHAAEATAILAPTPREPPPGWLEAWAHAVEVTPLDAIPAGFSKAGTMVRYAAFLGGITEEAIRSTHRARNVTRPRWVAMWTLQQFTSLSTISIGRRVGGRDHTSVLHGVKRVTAAIIAAGIDIPEDDWREGMRRAWAALTDRRT